MAKRTLTVEIVGDATRLSRGFKNAGADVNKSMSGVSSSVKKHSLSISKSLVGAAAGVAGLSVGIRELKASVNTLETLAKSTAMVSRTTGFDNKEASEWITLAKVRGVEAKQLNMGFVSLARNIKAGAAGTKASASAFKELGISQAELKRGNASEIIRDLSDKFAKLPDGANKAALAQRLFGRQAQTLLPLLNKGSGELSKQLGMVNKYGAALDKHGVKQAQKAVDAQRELSIAWQGVQIQLATRVIPFITKAASTFAGFVSAARKAIGPSSSFGRAWRDAAQAVGVAVGRASSWVKGAFSDIVAAVQRFRSRNRTEIRTAVQAFENLGKAARALGKAAKYVFEEVILPTIRVAVKRIGPIIQNLIGVLSGMIRFVTDVLTGKWSKAWGALKDTVRNSLQGAVRIVRGTVETFGTLALKIGGVIVKGVVKGLGSIGHAILGKIKDGIGWAADQAKGFLNKVNPFGDIGDGIGKTIGDGVGIGAGGVLPSGGAFGGSLDGARPSLRPFAALGARYGLMVTAGRNHHSKYTSSGNLSYHGSGEAIDMSGSFQGMHSFAGTLRSKYGGRLAELISPWPGLGIKDGRPFRYDAKTQAEHSGSNAHVHVAFDTGRPGIGDGIGKGLGRFSATSYGPPWGGIQGTGVTATGINLRGGPHKYGVAVDPNVIPLGTELKISPNPFGFGGYFEAFDTGGAIKGNRIDFYDWRGRSAQNNWGKRSVRIWTRNELRGGGGGGGRIPIPRLRPTSGVGHRTGPNTSIGSGNIGAEGMGTGRHTGPGPGLFGPGESVGDAQKLVDVGIEKATAAAHDNLAGMIRALQHERRLKLRRLKKVNRTLKRRIRKASRRALGEEKAQLIADLAEINGLLKEYRADARGGATTITAAEGLTAGVAPEGQTLNAGGTGLVDVPVAPDAPDVPTAADFANLQIAEAALTPGTADDIAATESLLGIRQGELNAARATGDPRKILDALQAWSAVKDSLDQLKQAVDLESETRQRMIDLLAGVKDELKAIHDEAASLNAIGYREALKFIADGVSGQVVGTNLQGRRQTAGNGRIAITP